MQLESYLLAQQIAAAQMREAIFLHDLGALGALAAARSAQNPDDGYVRL